MPVALFSKFSYEKHEKNITAFLEGQQGGVFDPNTVHGIKIELSEREQEMLAKTPDDLVGVAMEDVTGFMDQIPMEEGDRWNYIAVTAPSVVQMMETHAGIKHKMDEEAGA